MGDGNTSSFRWEKNRKLSPTEEATYWENKFWIAKGDNDYLLTQNERLALRVATLEKHLSLFMYKKGDELL